MQRERRYGSPHNAWSLAPLNKRRHAQGEIPLDGQSSHAHVRKLHTKHRKFRQQLEEFRKKAQLLEQAEEIPCKSNKNQQSLESICKQEQKQKHAEKSTTSNKHNRKCKKNAVPTNNARSIAAKKRWERKKQTEQAATTTKNEAMSKAAKKR